MFILILSNEYRLYCSESPSAQNGLKLAYENDRDVNIKKVIYSI